MRIAGLDPGKRRDSFALVFCDIKDGKLLVRGAKRWLGRDYIKVEDEIERIHNRIRFDRIIVEINNTGEHVFEVLKQQKNLPVFPVFTLREIKDLEKKHDPGKMDKNEMARIMLHWFEQGLASLPEDWKSSSELVELKRQLAIFAELKTDAGQFRYSAEGSEHDDMVLALMLICFHAKEIVGVPRNYEIYPVGGTRSYR